MKFAHCLYIVFVIRKYPDIFFRGDALDKDFYRETLRERNFGGLNIPGEMLLWGDYTELQYEISA